MINGVLGRGHNAPIHPIDQRSPAQSRQEKRNGGGHPQKSIRTEEKHHGNASNRQGIVAERIPPRPVFGRMRRCRMLEKSRHEIAASEPAQERSREHHYFDARRRPRIPACVTANRLFTGALLECLDSRFSISEALPALTPIRLLSPSNPCSTAWPSATLSGPHFQSWLVGR